MSKSSALAAALGRRRRRWQPRAGILMYHRVIADSADPWARHDPWAICVSAAAFAEQMAVLAQAQAAIELGEFAAADPHTRSGGRLAVTFDDGYLDNLITALPILERHGIPATVFVVGNGVGRGREFWWDALDRAIMAPAELPETLEFDFGDSARTFTIVEQPGDAELLRGWRAEGAPRTVRQRLFRELWDAIVVLAPSAQDAAVDHLLDWAGQPVAAPALRGPVDAEQFAALAEHPLITLGSHTLDHLSLTDLSPSAQRRQIHDGHRRVEELAGTRIDRFSYPFGRLDSGARAAVADLDVSVACTSRPTAVTRGDDRMALPRLQATEMDGERFARWLREEHALRLEHPGR